MNRKTFLFLLCSMCAAFVGCSSDGEEKKNLYIQFKCEAITRKQYEEGRAMKDYACGIEGAKETLEFISGRIQKQREKYFAF